MFDLKKFGANISKLRKDIDMTQILFAERLNITRQAVSRYENGESFPEVAMLMAMTQIFNVSIDDLINAGEPTKAEAMLLKSNITKTDIVVNALKNQQVADEVLNIAPLLRPTLLDKVAQTFAQQGMDISKLVALAEYMNDNSFLTLIENTTFDAFDKTLLEKFLPFLNEQSKYSIFEKIIEGELDYHYLEILLPYAGYLDSQIEAAVVYGVLDEDALRILNEYNP